MLKKDRYDERIFHEAGKKEVFAKDTTPKGLASMRELKKDKRYTLFQHLVVADCYYGNLDVASACEELGFYCLFCVSANKDSKIKEPALVGLKKGNARNIWNHRLKINYCVV